MDLGEPSAQLDPMENRLLLVEAAQREDLDATYVALVPNDLSLPEACNDATPSVWPAGCDLTEVAELHFNGYQQTITGVSDWFDPDTEFHLLAASFGSARWESMFRSDVFSEPRTKQ